MVGWWIGDRFDKRLISAACMLAHAVGLLLLTYAFRMWMLVGFAVLHGTAWGLRGPFMQAIRADYFGRAAIGMILGLSYMIIIIGQIGGPMIAGVFADATATTAPASRCSRCSPASARCSSCSPNPPGRCLHLR